MPHDVAICMLLLALVWSLGVAAIWAALIQCVKAAGGSKTVGARLWPEKTVEAAQRHLLHCLNESKPERLTPEQVLLVARLAREHGCHAYMEFCARSLSYAAPQPVRPADEVDELRRQVLEMGRTMQAALSRLQALDTPPSVEPTAPHP